MSSSMTLSIGDAKSRERRRRQRETLPCVVLVFFENENWGKLIEINEDGMSFEFAHSPSLRQRIRFTFQTMGSAPAGPSGEGLEESFQAAGEILWTRGFERIAGVRFVDLTEGSREQIRRWIASGKPTADPKAGQGAQKELPPAEPEPIESPRAHSETTTTAEVVEAAGGKPESTASANPKLEPRGAGEKAEAPQSETTYVPATGRQVESERRVKSNLPLTRMALIGFAGCLAGVAVFASARMVLSPGSGREANGQASGQVATGTTDPTFSSGSSGTAKPFEVEVADARGKRWMLGFAHSGAESAVNSAASRSLTLSRSGLTPGKTVSAVEASAAEKSDDGRERSWAPTSFGAPRTNGPTASASPIEAPVLSAEFEVPLVAPVGGQPTSPKAPATAPATQTQRAGGVVQQARLIRSVPAEYPEFAKVKHVGGDVVMDAVIDTAGNVTNVRAISGPPSLQQAAVEALRRWKYEPARLNGQAVTQHLDVTLKFRVN